MTTIRMADYLDEFEIFRLCQMMHDEQPAHPLSWERVTPMIRLATRHERGMIGVIGERGDIKGMVFLIVEPIWYSTDWHLVEYFNFVRPDCRKSTYAKDLIKYSMSCSEALGIDLSIGVFSNIRTAAKVKLYERLLPKAGAFFCYTPQSKGKTGALAASSPANAVPAE